MFHVIKSLVRLFFLKKKDKNKKIMPMPTAESIKIVHSSHFRQDIWKQSALV